jgi:hypothetical protein
VQKYNPHFLSTQTPKTSTLTTNCVLVVGQDQLHNVEVIEALLAALEPPQSPAAAAATPSSAGGGGTAGISVDDGATEKVNAPVDRNGLKEILKFL